MLLESLVKATVELQGFRVVTVTGTRGDWWPSWPQTFGSRPGVASVGNGAGTGTPAGDGTFAMCPCGGLRWRCVMRRGA